MPNYNEVTAPGTAWRRAYRIVIENPLEPSVQKSIRFFEEDVATIGTRTLKETKGTIEAFFDPFEEIVLRNPATDEMTPITITQQYLYQILYSLYRNKADDRDQL